MLLRWRIALVSFHFLLPYCCMVLLQVLTPEHGFPGSCFCSFAVARERFRRVPLSSQSSLDSLKSGESNKFGNKVGTG
jgi:hypothetical protein